MAGADHLPSKCSPLRQSNGPRPPLPPTPKPNFFTLGRINTQLDLDSKAGEMLLPLSISCRTRLAFLRVSSSFCLSAANAGVKTSRAIVEATRQRKAMPAIRSVVFLHVFIGIGVLLLSSNRCSFVCVRRMDCFQSAAVLGFSLVSCS